MFLAIQKKHIDSEFPSSRANVSHDRLMEPWKSDWQNEEIKDINFLIAIY